MADCYREDGPSFLIKINAPVAASFNFSFQTPKKEPCPARAAGPMGQRAGAPGRPAEMLEGRTQTPRKDPTDCPHGRTPNEKPHLTLE